MVRELPTFEALDAKVAGFPVVVDKLALFLADCPYSHPPGRKVGGGDSIGKEGFAPYKPKDSSLVDRSFGGAVG
jgi:hypothetical protein